MYTLFKILVVILITLYPFLVYFGLNYFTLSQIAIVLFAVFASRIVFLRKNQFAKNWPVLLTVVIGAALAGLSWLYGNADYLLWYPVGLNAALFVVFSASILFPPTVIEYMARLTNKNLPENAVRYTRKVTVVWAIFFVINASIAAWTTMHGDMKLWTLYNGLVAYLAIGLIFAIEYLVRRHVRKNEDV